ncbi:MAG: sensor histidine kinase [Bacteroidota bacterium]
MNSIIELTRKFLVNHSVWMHLTIILMMSYLMVQVSHLTQPKFYYLWVLGLLIFSIPALLLALLRTTAFRAKSEYYWASWVMVFILFPLVLFYLRIDIVSLPFAYQLANVDIDGSYTFTALSVLFLLLELFLIWTGNGSATSVNLQFLSQLSIFKSIAIVVALACLFGCLSNNYYPEVTRADSGWVAFLKFIYYWIQLFIIYLSYYLYYYIHHKILYKGVLKQRGLIPYFLGLGLTIVTIVPIHNILISWFPVVHDLKLHPTAIVNLFDDLNFGLAIMALVLSFPLIVIIEWYRQSYALTKLEKEKSLAELNLLKQQINPHFFFNTLNNLYSMSLNEDKETPETILQLSELMRYVIYKGKEEKVRLKDEVKYMKDYIQLQMIRVHQNVNLKMDFKLDDEDLEVSPLLFVILLENAFKHGIEPAGDNSMLHISLKEQMRIIHFECLNSKPKDSSYKSGGIGLSNLKKRLEIVYPDRHALHIEEDACIYKATLKITL